MPLATFLLLLALAAMVPPPAIAGSFRQIEQMRQEQRTLPADQLRQLAVDGWGSVTVTGSSTDRITATATLRAWAPTTAEAEAMLHSLRWYLDPAGGGTALVGAHGPSQRDAIQYRGQRYGKQSRLDLVIAVPVGFTVDVTTDSGDVRLRSLAGAKVRVAGGTVLLEQINGAIDVETKAGAITGRAIGGRAWLVSGNGKLSIAGVGGKLVAKTGSGAIEARDVRGDAELTTKTGRITATGIAGGLVADTGTGAIQAVRIGGPCELRTTFGKIAGSQLSGAQIVARTSSGAIQLEQGGIRTSRYDLRSAQGPIELGVDPGASLAVTLTSAFGRVETSLPIDVTNGSPRGRDPHRLLGQLNGGRLPLKAVSDSGSILLRAAR